MSGTIGRYLGRHMELLGHNELITHRMDEGIDMVKLQPMKCDIKNDSIWK